MFSLSSSPYSKVQTSSHISNRYISESSTSNRCKQTPVQKTIPREPHLMKTSKSYIRTEQTDYKYESTSTSKQATNRILYSEIRLASSKIQCSLKKEQIQFISDLSSNQSKKTSKYINEPCDPSRTIPQYKSEIEQKIRNSKKPFETKENFIIFEGKQYVWLNKEECDNWKGVKPLSEYATDFSYENAEVVNLKHSDCIVKKKTYKIKYLKPPKLEIPPPIIIEQEPDYYESPPPPLILRQSAPSQNEVEIKTIREMPPNSPNKLSTKLINIAGKQLPSSPRRVIIEQLAPEPAISSEVYVERWLPYERCKRSIFLKDKPLPSCIEQPTNTIYKWTPQCMAEEIDFEVLGEVPTDPKEYKEKYGSTLISTSALPREVLDNCDDKLKTCNQNQEYVVESDKDMYRKFYYGLSEEGRKYLSEIFKEDNSNSIME